MKTRSIARLLFTAVVIVLFASCSKTNKQGKMIPKEAAVVMHINGASLLNKLPWEEIKKMEILKDMLKDSSMPAFIRGIVENPENSGIDVKSDIMIFAVKDQTGSYVAIQGSVKDAAKFNTFNTLISEGGSSYEKEGITFISKAPMCAGWNKEKFVYVVDAPQFADMGGNFGGRNNDRQARDIAVTCKSVFDLKEDNSLAKSEKFSKLMDETGDMHFYVNTNELMKGATALGMMSMLKVDDLYKDSYSTGTLNFDNGKITIGFKGYSGEKLTELYKKYKTEDINADMVKRFPGKDISAMLAISYRPEFFKDLITLTGTDGFVNLGLTKSGTGLTLDDIIKSQKGDVFIAATNVQNKPDTLFYGTGPNQYFVSNKPKADYIFSVSINDKAAFNNLIKTAQKLDEGRNMMIDSAVPKKPAPFVYASNDKYFVIGADKSYVDQYLAGGNNSYEFMKNLGGYPIGGYVNINSLIKSISAGNAKDSTDLQLVDLSLKMWQDAYVKGGKFTDGASTQNFEINLVDKNVNSLKQLIDYFDKIAVIEKKKSEQAMEKFRIEEETTAAPMAPVVPDAPVTKTPKHR